MLTTRSARFGLTLALLTISAHHVSGQSISVDPYDPWNSMYRPFVFPSAVPNASVPNQGRLNLIGGSNLYGEYLDSIGVASSSDPFGRLGRPSGRFTPLRQGTGQSGAFDRSYSANRYDSFFDDQQKRERELIEASRIEDPRLRADTLKKLQRQGLQSTRSGRAARGYRPPAAPARRAPAPPPPSVPTPANAPAPAARTPGTGRVEAVPAAGTATPGLLDRGLVPTPSRRGASPAATLRRSRAMDRLRNSSDAGPRPEASPADETAPR